MNIILLLILSMQLTRSNILLNKLTFKQYKSKYNKQYPSFSQQIQRQIIYKNNKKIIKQLINCQYCGITYFGDTTQEQFENKMLKLKLNQIQKDKNRQQVNYYEHSMFINLQNFPDSYNWIMYNVVTSIKDKTIVEQSQIYAVVALLESFNILNLNLDNSINLSQQFVTQCGMNNRNITDLMNSIIQINGLPLQNDISPKNFLNNCSEKYDYQNISKKVISKFQIQDHQIIKYLLLNPIVVVLAANNWQFYAPNNQDIFSCEPNNLVNYAALLVGYTSQYWIIKNYWGTDWGNNGYIYINRSREDNKNCQIGKQIYFFANECNISNCSICQINKLSCYQCQIGFYRQFDGLCKQCQDSNCYKCFDNSQLYSLTGKCRICKQGWSLDSNQLTCVKIQIQNCQKHIVAEQLNNQCLVCDIDYSMAQNQCIKCQIANCHQCLKDNSKQCKICYYGYAGINCQIKCLDNCAMNCMKPYICDKCVQQFVGQYCQKIACNIQNCDIGCTQPNICDKCNLYFYGQNCQIYQSIFTDIDNNTIITISIISTIVVLIVIVIICIIVKTKLNNQRRKIKLKEEEIQTMINDKEQSLKNKKNQTSELECHYINQQEKV